MDAKIAYQNKDIVSKFFGGRMKGKPLSLFGLETDLRVADTRPTNIPIVEAKELRIDNLFELEDGSVAILDYESSFKETNFTKYGRYIMNVIDRYLGEGKRPDIHMMVLYTADIGRAKTSLHKTACDIRVEASYMADAPSEQWMNEIKEGIVNGIVTEEALMHLTLLPLTYHGMEQQQAAIRQCVELAMELPEKEQKSFALAGILAFTDKIIGEDMKKYIKEVLRMTKIESELIEESRLEGKLEGRLEGRQEGRLEGRQEGRLEGDYERAKKTAFKMYEKKYSLEHISDIIDFPISTIQEWLAAAPSKA